MIDSAPVGAVRRVQAALGAMNLAEVIAHHRGQSALANRPPLGDSRQERPFSLSQSATQPLGQGQIPSGYGRHHPLVVTYLEQGSDANEAAPSASPRSAASKHAGW